MVTFDHIIISAFAFVSQVYVFLNFIEHKADRCSLKFMSVSISEFSFLHISAFCIADSLHSLFFFFFFFLFSCP